MESEPTVAPRCTNIEQFKELLLKFPNDIIPTTESTNEKLAELTKYVNPTIQTQVEAHIQKILKSNEFVAFCKEVESLQRIKESSKSMDNQRRRIDPGPGKINFKQLACIALKNRNKSLQKKIAHNNKEINMLVEHVEKKRNIVRDISARLTNM